MDRRTDGQTGQEDRVIPIYIVPSSQSKNCLPEYNKAQEYDVSDPSIKLSNPTRACCTYWFTKWPLGPLTDHTLPYTWRI